MIPFSYTEAKISHRKDCSLPPSPVFVFESCFLFHSAVRKQSLSTVIFRAHKPINLPPRLRVNNSPCSPNSGGQKCVCVAWKVPCPNPTKPYTWAVVRSPHLSQPLSSCQHSHLLPLPWNVFLCFHNIPAGPFSMSSQDLPSQPGLWKPMVFGAPVRCFPWLTLFSFVGRWPALWALKPVSSLRGTHTSCFSCFHVKGFSRVLSTWPLISLPGRPGGRPGLAPLGTSLCLWNLPPALCPVPSAMDEVWREKPYCCQSGPAIRRARLSNLNVSIT